MVMSGAGVEENNGPSTTTPAAFDVGLINLFFKGATGVVATPAAAAVVALVNAFVPRLGGFPVFVSDSLNTDDFRI